MNESLYYESRWYSRELPPFQENANDLFSPLWYLGRHLSRWLFIELCTWEFFWICIDTRIWLRKSSMLEKPVSYSVSIRNQELFFMYGNFVKWQNSNNFLNTFYIVLNSINTAIYRNYVLRCIYIYALKISIIQLKGFAKR